MIRTPWTLILAAATLSGGVMLGSKVAGADAISTLDAPKMAGGKMMARNWLDKPLDRWNRRGETLPSIPEPRISDAEKGNLEKFGSLVRRAETEGEVALTRNGWFLYGPVQSYGNTRVVTAMAGVDATGQPVGYQAFVYWEGRYAGTLSPTPMRQNWDAALTSYRLVNESTIEADFARLTTGKPANSPTSTTVTYRLRADDIPDLVASQLVHRPSGAGSAAVVADLAGKKWVLTGLGTTPVPGGKAYLEFNLKENRVSGSGGCNRVMGGFTLAGSTLKFGEVVSTMMACADDEANRIESGFLGALNKVSRYTVAGNTLRLFGGDTLLLELTAQDELAGKKWVLSRLGGRDIAGGKAFLEFNPKEQRISGSGGCNRVMGAYTRTGNSLTFGQVASTRMACLDEEANRVESEFLGALEKVTGYALEGNTLKLLSGEAVLLELTSA